MRTKETPNTGQKQAWVESEYTRSIRKGIVAERDKAKISFESVCERSSDPEVRAAWTRYKDLVAFDKVFGGQEVA